LNGPPSVAKLSKLSKETSSENELAVEFMSSSLNGFTDCEVLFINESKLGYSPQMEIKISNKFVVNAILDSGSEVNLLSEVIYEELSKSGLGVPVLPVENVVLVTAFGRKSKRIRQQVLIDFTVGQDSFESVFMISYQLTNEAIIGCQFLIEYGIRINFDLGTFSYVRKGILKEHAFLTKAGLPDVNSNDRKETYYQIQPSAGQCPNQDRVVHSCSETTSPETVVTGSERKNSTRYCCVTESRSNMLQRVLFSMSPRATS
jgi:hypothetical protein